MTAPTWGTDASRYAREGGEAAVAMGVDDWPSPVVVHVPDGARVLDLGCATGHTARLLSQQGCTVVGVEIDPIAAASARAWCESVHVVDLDTADLGRQLDGQRFDVITAGDILEHLRDPVTTLANLSPLLAAGGVVIASIPNIAHGSVRIALLSGTFAYRDFGILDKTHLRFFTLDTIKATFAAAGYELVDVDRVSAPLELGEPYDASTLPPEIEEAVRRLEEAETYSFVVQARPVAGADPTPTGAKAAEVPALPPELELLRRKDLEVAELRRTVVDTRHALAALEAEHAAATLSADGVRAQLQAQESSRVWRGWMAVRPAYVALKDWARNRRRD
ncbi:MAG: class I SAM-dependent methyltransferase [Acidimicrobiales bacterium]